MLLHCHDLNSRESLEVLNIRSLHLGAFLRQKIQHDIGME